MKPTNSLKFLQSSFCWVGIQAALNWNILFAQRANSEDATISGIIAGEYVTWAFMSCGFR